VSSPPADPLVTEQAGSANLRAPATLRLLNLRIGVVRAKEVGVLGAGFALLAALAGLCVAAKRRRASELTRILSRYGAWIVPINSPLVCPKIVDVSSMDALVRLAEHYERAILHEEQGRSHSFALEEDGTLFRYRIHTGDVQPLRAEQPIRLDEHIPAVTRFRR
jgi:hypothetical protein